jgi:hypothetical protein
MTPHQAKQDAAQRLQGAGVGYAKLTAKTVSFEGLGYGVAIFVTIHAAYNLPKGWKDICFHGVPKPSEGGYVPELGGGYQFAK